MKKEIQGLWFQAKAIRAWLFGGVAAFALCLLGGRGLAAAFENIPKYEQYLTAAVYLLLFLSGAAGGVIASLMTGNSSPLHGAAAAAVQALLQLLSGLLFAGGLCPLTELGLRLSALVGGGIGASELLFLLGKRGRKRRKSFRKKRER